MQVLLTMILCSSIHGSCLDPFPFSKHDSYYDCLISGYEEAINKTKELGRSEINKNEIVVKFNCTYVKGTNA